MKRASHSAVTVETLPVITFQGVRVLTTDILAQVYGAAPINIQQNYANNKDRFESEKHFFLLVGDDLREFKQLHRLDKKGSVKISPQVKALTLWTERGAARHAKMLETDQAWDVFEKLEDAYFRPLSINPHPMKQPTSAAIPTDLPTALRAYAAEIESHHDDSSMIEMLNQQLEILKELLEICLNQLAFQQCDDPDKATSKAFRHQLSAPFINYIAKDHHLHETPKDDAFRRALDQLFIGTFEELKTIKAYLEITFRW